MSTRRLKVYNPRAMSLLLPCIAHVIQLSLKSLLGKMKAIPKNDKVEQTWSDDRVEALRATQQKREIVHTLGKRSETLRFILKQVLAPTVFLQLAEKSDKASSNPGCCHSVELHIPNARTSSLRCFLLPVRPRALCLKPGAGRQVDYLLCILEPFHRFTMLLCKTKTVTIHRVFKIYNKLSDHLEKSINQIPWGGVA